MDTGLSAGFHRPRRSELDCTCLAVAVGPRQIGRLIHFVNGEAPQTVTFRVTNTGAIPHDFTLGDEATQQSHAEDMEEMAGMAMPDEPNAVVVDPGETRELTWHFAEAGELLIGCHQTGHYEAGMKAQDTVQG